MRVCSLKCFGGEGEGCSGASYVLPGAFVAQMATMPLGPYFQDKIGCQASPCIILLLLTVAPLQRPADSTVVVVVRRDFFVQVVRYVCFFSRRMLFVFVTEACTAVAFAKG